MKQVLTREEVEVLLKGLREWDQDQADDLSTDRETWSWVPGLPGARSARGLPVGPCRPGHKPIRAR